MRQVLYRSRTVGSLEAGELAAIVENSTRRNASRGITGFLLNFDDRIVQFIEGPAMAIAHLLNMLTGDPRHREIEVLADLTTTDRWFADWSMKHLISFAGTPALEELRLILVRHDKGEEILTGVMTAVEEE